ncbi:MAG: DUF3040 domain-containing protein [Actinomycetes bacterium]
MPLSEHEQRLLEQMERALYAEDPKFAASLRGRTLRVRYRRRAVLAAAGFLLGIVLLMTGLITQKLAVSILGFVVMLATAFLAITAWRGMTTGEATLPPPVAGPGGGQLRGLPGLERGRTAGRKPRSKRSTSSGTFMQRLEDRWERRRRER